MPYLIPELEIKEKEASREIFALPLASLMYINAKVPMGMQHKWRLLYSTKLHGESFSKLTGAIINQGPTILVVKDQEGHIFGGYASSNWEFSSQFQGTVNLTMIMILCQCTMLIVQNSILKYSTITLFLHYTAFSIYETENPVGLYR